MKFDMKGNICNEHNRNAIVVADSLNLEREKRILCDICVQTKSLKVSGVDLVRVKIENKLKANREKLYQRINYTLTKFKELKGKQEEFKQNIMQQLDTIYNILDEWDSYFTKMKNQILEYSLIDEVDKIAKEQDSKYEQELFHKIISDNKSFETKLSDQFSKASNFNNIQEILKDIVNIDHSGCCNKEKKKIINQQSKVSFNTIGGLEEQKEQCNAVAFNNQGSIMISTLDKQIKVWKFNDGILKLEQTLIGHEDSVQCLFFLKLKNSFISSSKNDIKIWFLDSQQWTCLQTIQASVTCITTDLKDKQIFFGRTDNSIEVWKFNEQNLLSDKYDLKKHDQQVSSLSLNELETILVSCAKVSEKQSLEDYEQIIVWEKNMNNQFIFKHFVKQPHRLEGPQHLLINGNNIFLICENINQAFLFLNLEVLVVEFVQLEFKDSPERLFPILYNKDKKLLYFKFKSYIYILTSNLKTQSILHSSGLIQGAFTNDGQYLVFWDEQHKGYQTFQISYH
ncbi:unnamed protein product [Paramecium octaurelia]|uniref:Uncharacterized protein n=1 Tax=Paramecium octaurelia TaxID=43137 RepID=A0A8S1YH72_PAROT|nr:unnamed protein product [Paramecium octaurelia]